VQLRRDNALLRERLHEKHRFNNIVGDSAELQAVFDVVKRAAPTRATVLVLGESGTGKRAHRPGDSRRVAAARQAVREGELRGACETLLESELFGHEKGSFTGAAGKREGRFELADGGTLFLDEIGDVTPALQVKLLRVLQQKEFERVGGTQTLKVDVRVVAATNKDLAAEVKASKFREDLFYRLNVVSVTLPPLRKRKSDIPRS
jgi:two-component system NtrC family response regulator